MRFVPGSYGSDGPDFNCDFYAEGGNCQLYGSDSENSGKPTNEAYPGLQHIVRL